MVERGEKGEVEGTILDFIYRDEESHFTVARVDVGGGREEKIVGKLPGVLPGERISAQGTWKDNERFGGRDLQVTDFEVTEPQGIQAITKYLSSGMVAEIGPVMAGRIVNAFGLQTLDVIEEHPERLRTVEGIGPKRAAAISEAWKKQRRIKDVMVFLFKVGISAAYAARVFMRYGDTTVDLVKTNPYLLTMIDGIGFKRADAVARRMGIPTTSPFRVQAGVEFVLGEATKNGHCFLTVSKLHQDACRLLGVPVENVDEALRSMARTAKIKVEGDLDTGTTGVYLTTLYHAESKVGSTLAAMARLPIEGVRGPNRQEVEGHLGFELSDTQWSAVVQASMKRVVVVTGGPGTGKTTLVKAILYVLQAQRVGVLMAAPTGRAAKRMQESTGWDTRTIHRLLEYHPDEGWRVNRDSPLPSGMVIVDEVSMMDINLAYRLVDALTTENRLVLVGDVDQLPSVGPGAVLRDTIDSGVVPVIRLDVIYRQAAGSMIIANAHRVQAEEKLAWEPEDGQRWDMSFLETDENQSAAQVQILTALRQLKDEGFDPIRDVQILTPMRRGDIGTQGLNALLQGRLNKGGRAAMKFKDGTIFRVGDKVMQIRNNYDLDIYNGDVGTVVGFQEKPFRMDVEIDGRVVEYRRDQAWSLQLAYAATIHKSQGSEYPAVIVVVHWSHYIMLARNLFYTAITRGRRRVVVVGMRKALGRACSNNRPVERNTNLVTRLQSPKPQGLFDAADGVAL